MESFLLVGANVHGLSKFLLVGWNVILLDPNFVGNWFFTYQCKTIHLFVKYS